MRLTTKFSAFVTLLTGLAMFVTLLGSSLSFYNAIQYKVANRVESVAAVVDSRLIFTSLSTLKTQLDELMVPIDIVGIEIRQGKKTVLQHTRKSSYRPAGSNFQYRELQIDSLKNPGMVITMVYQDPMANYFRSLVTTVPLTLAIGFMILIVFLSVRWLRRQLSGQALLELRSTHLLNGERGT